MVKQLRKPPTHGRAGAAIWTEQEVTRLEQAIVGKVASLADMARIETKYDTQLKPAIRALVTLQAILDEVGK